jgi:hypothetical protein
MADRYIDENYITERMGAGIVEAIQEIRGISLTSLIESATSTVQSFMRNSGYATPSTQDPTEITEIAVKDAVCMAVWIAAAAIPEASLKLSDNYKEHPAYQAYSGIVTGNVPLSAQPSQSGAVGGMLFSTSTVGVSGSLTQRTSRENLSGY